MLRTLSLVFGLVSCTFRSRRSLLLQILALRQQLVIAQKSRPSLCWCSVHSDAIGSHKRMFSLSTEVGNSDGSQHRQKASKTWGNGDLR